jgi:uncharacterized protein YcbX
MVPRMSGTVLELWRYPVKSLLGERVDEAEIDERGLRGDRLWAVTDGAGKLGSGKTSTRFRRLDGLFDLRARGIEAPVVTLPDGRDLPVADPELDAYLRARYADDSLTVSRETTVMHHDLSPLHLLTTSSLRWLAERVPASQIDRRRFRPNVLLETAGSERLEDDWTDARFALGSAILRVTSRMARCVMTTNPQEELPPDPDVLRPVTELNETCLGVAATVEQPGVVRLGDALRPL